MENVTMTWSTWSTPHKYNKEWPPENGIIFSTSYREDKPGCMRIEVYDKRGNVRSKIELNEQMLRDLKQDIDMALGIIKKVDD